MKFKKKYLALLAVPGLAFGLAACGEDPGAGYEKVEQTRSKLKAYQPKNNVESTNYNRAQELYDSPNTIIWCTTTWGNPSAPLVTVPIAGKLTSSSVSFFPNYTPTEYGPKERMSLDGMYHGSPPPYRYGFTPGGQYVDLFNMDTYCTTQLTKFQRQSTQVAFQVDQETSSAQARAERALASGDREKADQILQEALNE